MYRSLIVVLLFFTSLIVEAQKDVFFTRLNNLNIVDDLPPELLSSKTVVLVKTPYKSRNPDIRGDWKPMTELAQKGFYKSGIDAVAYYYIDDIMSGPESYHKFLDAFDDRNLSHAAILDFDGTTYTLTILKLKDRQFLIKENQDAWRIEGTDLNKIFADLYRKAANSRQPHTNLLIIETPEYGQMVDVVTGKRAEYYDLNLSSFTLGIIPFADTAQINNVMAHYPYKWTYIQEGFDERELRSDGIQYVLYYVNSTAKSTKMMLEYPFSPNEGAFVSEVVIDGKSEITSQNVNAEVYKFYIKQLRSNNTFIGKRWDAGYTWQQGLLNYINNMRNELIRN